MGEIMGTTIVLTDYSLFNLGRLDSLIKEGWRPESQQGLPWGRLVLRQRQTQAESQQVRPLDECERRIILRWHVAHAPD